MIYNLYKQRGETPLECIQRFAKSKLGLKGEKMTYLGRLDPMAEGVLLMASGEDVQRKEEFLSLDKEYDFVSIFGFSTDTYDILGRIMRVEKIAEDPISLENQIRRVVSVYEGEREQKYPLYSSKGLALKKQNNSLAEDELPSKKITIHKINFHGLDALSNQELFGRLLMDISKVSGDFRQHEILVLWKEILLGSGSSHFNKKEISEKENQKYSDSVIVFGMIQK